MFCGSEFLHLPQFNNSPAQLTHTSFHDMINLYTGETPLVCNVRMHVASFGIKKKSICGTGAHHKRKLVSSSCSLRFGQMLETGQQSLVAAHRWDLAKSTF